MKQGQQTRHVRTLRSGAAVARLALNQETNGANPFCATKTRTTKLYGATSPAVRRKLPVGPDVYWFYAEWKERYNCRWYLENDPLNGMSW